MQILAKLISPIPNNKKVIIELELHNCGTDINLQLPTWRPGRYEELDFAQYIYRLDAFCDNKPITCKKTTSASWQIKATNKTLTKVTYTFYAGQVDAGGSFVDENLFYINFINCIPYILGKENEIPYTIELDLPEHYQNACSLKKTNRKTNTFYAENYHILADSPLLASSKLRTIKYKIANTTFHLVFHGHCQPNQVVLKEQFEAFSKEQIKLFGDYPSSDYYFLFLIRPNTCYHGVEHNDSTVIVLGPDKDFEKNNFQHELLGVSSHELFHAWNVKRIRPIEMLPYQYNKELYHETGYITEGVTTYYGDYMLVRSGVYDDKAFLKEINTHLKRHYDNYGRYNYSLAESSHDLWLDGYKAGIPGRKVSIYVKGALCAMILDLLIRKSTENKASLGTIMRLMWERYGKQNIGYTSRDYQHIIEEVTGSSFEFYFKLYIEGTKDLESILNESLAHVGCILEENDNPLIYETNYGFKLDKKDLGYLVSVIAPNSPAELVLCVGDIITGINGYEIGDDFCLYLNPYRNDFLINRNGVQIACTMHSIPGNRYFTSYAITKNNNASQIQAENYKLWLNQLFSN